jgi:tetratricopeptide (TPR) repeat protein
MKNLLYIFTFVITSTVIAQNTTSVAFELQKMNQAKIYGDEEVIASSIYNIIALEGPTSTYKDTLAYVYFNKRKYVSCFLVVNDVLKTKPDNIEMLEMKAISLESMGALEKAKEAYEVLLQKNNNNYTAYKLAGLEFRMNQNEVAYATIKKAAALPNDVAMNVTFQVNENYNQNVPLNASIFYLQGLIAQSLNKPSDAKASYEKAIELFPEFVLAKSKLEVLNAKLAQDLNQN